MDKLIVDPECSCLQDERTITECNQIYGVNPTARNALKIDVLASNPDLYSNRRWSRRVRRDAKKNLTEQSLG